MDSKISSEINIGLSGFSETEVETRLMKIEHWLSDYEFDSDDFDLGLLLNGFLRIITRLDDAEGRDTTKHHWLLLLAKYAVTNQSDDITTRIRLQDTAAICVFLANQQKTEAFHGYDANEHQRKLSKLGNRARHAPNQSLRRIALGRYLPAAQSLKSRGDAITVDAIVKEILIWLELWQMPEDARQALYALEDPHVRIKSWIEDARTKNELPSTKVLKK